MCVYVLTSACLYVYTFIFSYLIWLMFVHYIACRYALHKYKLINTVLMYKKFLQKLKLMIFSWT